MPTEYDNWMAAKTPENMASVLKTMEPAINSEIQRFPGPKPLLRSRARSLAIKAVKSYTPTEGTQLRSWVITNLQPLSRYGQQMRPVKAPEMALRQSAELNRIRGELSDSLGYDPSDEELADEVGISTKRIKHIRDTVHASTSEGGMASQVSEDDTAVLPAVSETNRLSVAQEAVYDSLSPRDKAIFDWKIGAHGKPMLTNQDIAKRLGVSPALISQRSQQVANNIVSVNESGVL